MSIIRCQVPFTFSIPFRSKESPAVPCHGDVFQGLFLSLWTTRLRKSADKLWSIFFLKKMILCSVILSGLCLKIAIYHAGISRWTSSVQSLGTKSSAQRVWNNHHRSRCFHAHLGNADRRCDLTPFEWQLLPLSEILIYIRLKARLRKFVSECYTELLSSTPKDTLYLLVICSIHLNIDRESLAALR